MYKCLPIHTCTYTFILHRCPSYPHQQLPHSLTARAGNLGCSKDLADHLEGAELVQNSTVGGRDPN